MTAPQLPAGWGAPSAPAAPPAQTAYAPQQLPPTYAPQQLPPPQYAPPQGGQYLPYNPMPQPGYPQQLSPGYPPAGPVQYAPQPPTPAGPAPQHGTLADYANQPESGASFWKFKNPGDTNMGVVSRDLVDTDTVERTYRGQVQKRFDGSSDWVLRIPMTNADGTDGVWEVGGKDRTALKNALIAAGKADGIPAKGWAIRATFTHFQQNQQGQPSRIKEIQVAPPNGQAQQSQDQAAYLAPNPGQVPPPVQQPASQALPQQPHQDPQYAAWLASQQQSAPQQPAPQAQPAPQQFQPPAGMPADAAAQFASLLGGAAPPQG